MAPEDRLNRIEEKLDKEITASAEFRGELRAYMAGAKEYTAAVSAKAGKAQDGLDAHEKDPNAHGAGVKREIDGKVLGWAGVAVGILTVFGGAVGAGIHKLFAGGKP